MRVALAGLGGAAKRGHLPALLELEREGSVTLVGACDPDPERHAAVWARARSLPVFESTEEMIKSVDSELIVIATPPSVQAEIARLVSIHRQHILCEKPAGVTPEQIDVFEALQQGQRDLGLLGSYQYRFSPAWEKVISPFLREAVRSGRPVTMSVDVQRPATDCHAVSNWRDDQAMGGGLADHAVHFLALGRELGRRFDTDIALREYDIDGRERVHARLAAGPNLVNISVSYRAAIRSTVLTLSCGSQTLRWEDAVLRRERDGTCGSVESVPSLSDRSHVDALYRPMYCDLLAGIHDRDWRHDHAQELLDVGRCLTSLLAKAESSFDTAPPAIAA
jgi:predicted dehydrogenase